MKTKALSTLFLLGFCSFGLALRAQEVVIPTNPDPGVRRSTQSVPRAAVVNPMAVTEDWASNMHNTSKVHTPGLDARRDAYREAKAAANRQRDSLRSIQGLPPSEKTMADPGPTLGTNFAGQGYDALPNDNDIAVSNGGKVVSVSNTLIYMYDETGGAPITNISLDAFGNQGGLPASFKFDPLANYDPINDRFIVVFVSGASPSNSKVIIAASQTNDPSGSWNFYSFNGNANGSSWCDFPQIGLSTQELFITGNLFNSSDVFTEGVVWQIPLSELYAGTPLTVTTHLAPYFSIHPVEGGATLYGPHFYFLTNENSGSSRDIRLHVMTNTAAAGGVLNAPLAFQSDISYGIAPDAGQMSTSTDLATNDCRIQNSYYNSYRIHFTCNTNFGGKPAVYVGLGQLSPFNLSFSAFTAQVVSDVRDLAYGSIAYAGTDAYGDVSYIGFNFAGESYYPGNGVVQMDGLGTVSNVTVAKNGSGPMMFGGNPMRWGDYADIQTRFSNPGEAWLTGSWGGPGGSSRTWLSQILPPTPVSADAPTVSQAEVTVFPNPGYDWVTVDFTVPQTGTYRLAVYNVEGKMVKLLLEDRLREGTARATFDARHLVSGTYFVRIESEGKAVFTKKLEVTH